VYGSDNRGLGACAEGRQTLSHPRELSRCKTLRGKPGIARQTRLSADLGLAKFPLRRPGVRAILFLNDAAQLLNQPRRLGNVEGVFLPGRMLFSRIRRKRYLGNAQR
jgi:hypothetical protein